MEDQGAKAQIASVISEFMEAMIMTNPNVLRAPSELAENGFQVYDVSLEAYNRETGGFVFDVGFVTDLEDNRDYVIIVNMSAEFKYVFQNAKHKVLAPPKYENWMASVMAREGESEDTISTFSVGFDESLIPMLQEIASKHVHSLLDKSDSQQQQEKSNEED